ncbi:hypothetical protein [Mesorhizobium sp.]|uniref:hypothetical protein n=1 Tax=Mesorhizobium sp. TaxID=1871066 RepID=UPI0025F60E6E|nr:hypothetical protein [Mesorhizobium sp.]
MGVVLSLGTFLALSQPQVKPEMGMGSMRGKQVAPCGCGAPSIAAQHILPAMQHFVIPQCTNCLEL